MSLPTKPLRALIRAAAEVASLPYWGDLAPGTWLEGMVMTESSGNPRAMRYEPHLDKVGDGDAPGFDDGTREDDRSFGLLQVLGLNIRHRWGVAPGVPMDFTAALDPLFGLAVGVAHLRDELRATGDDVPRALCRYNGGPTGDRILTPGGPMRRQEYVDKVKAWAEKVRAEVQGGGS